MNQLEEYLHPIFTGEFPNGTSSAAYAIMIDGKVIAKDSFGKNEKHTGTYNVGSISKVFCTVAVMQLVERGLVDLDRPICEYLPKFKMPDERYKKITVRQCLSHSSSLPGTHYRGGFTSADAPADYYDETYRSLGYCTLHSDPGTFSVYCNDGFTLGELLVVELTGMSYGEYVRKYITDPIGAYSTRLSSARNTDYPHTNIVGQPEELIPLEGAGGVRTTMEDLCKFGSIFLTENSILSAESKAEMGRQQGLSIVEDDRLAQHFGLGWDSVAFIHNEFDLGEHVIEKGGGTIQFGSRFFVVPKYNAVLSIASTFDAGVSVEDIMCKLFAYAMYHERGISIFRECVPYPEELKARYEGRYVGSGGMFRISLNGPQVTFTLTDPNLGDVPAGTALYDGTLFRTPKKNESFRFTTCGGCRYVMHVVHGKASPYAINAADLKLRPLSEKWKAQIGRKFINASSLPNDLATGGVFCGLSLMSDPDFPDAVIVGVTTGASQGCAMMPTVATPCFGGTETENMLCGALNMPFLSGRDQETVLFREDGVTCVCAGYIFRDVATLEPYAGQAFPETAENGVYTLSETLEALPEIPEGRRVMLFSDKLCVIYDSLTSGEYKPVPAAYISLI